MIQKRILKNGEPRWDAAIRRRDRTVLKRTFSTERAARRFIADYDVAYAENRWVDPRSGRVTLSQLYPEWIATQPHLSSKTRRTNADEWSLRVEPYFGSLEVGAIDRSAIQAWVITLCSVPSPTTGKPLARSTVEKTLRVVRQLLDVAVDRKMILDNPTAGIKLPQQSVERPHRYLTSRQVASLSDKCASQGDIVEVLAYTGLRLGEMVGLNCEDVSFERRRLYVRRSITGDAGKLVESTGKSRSAMRTVPFPRRLTPIFYERIAGRPAHHPAIAAPRGGRLRRENWVRDAHWDEATRAIGVPDLRIHDLRHTFASLARSAGADLVYVSKVMGHADVKITAAVYADLFDDDLDRVSDAMDSLD